MVNTISGVSEQTIKYSICAFDLLTGQNSISNVDVPYWLIVVYFTVSSLVFHSAGGCFKCIVLVLLL